MGPPFVVGLRRLSLSVAALMRFRRVPLRRIRTLDDVEAFIRSSPGRNVVIFDIDNTLVPQHVRPDDFIEVVNAAIDRFEANPTVERVIALTNGPQRDVTRIVSRGNKPWTTRRRLGLRGVQSPIVVVGDQVLTDGLLAWRLGATHLHLVLDDRDEPSRQASMRRVGRIFALSFFREEA